MKGPDTTGRKHAPPASPGDPGAARGERSRSRLAAALPVPSRDRHGRFVKGVSGNPAGRPPGSLNRVASTMLELLGASAEALMAKGISSALAGDCALLALLLPRVVPPAQHRPVSIDLPPVRKASDVLEALNNLMAAVADGRLTPVEAQTIAALIERQSDAIETHQVAAALEELEREFRERDAR